MLLTSLSLGPVSPPSPSSLMNRKLFHFVLFGQDICTGQTVTVFLGAIHTKWCLFMVNYFSSLRRGEKLEVEPIRMQQHLSQHGLKKYMSDEPGQVAALTSCKQALQSSSKICLSGWSEQVLLLTFHDHTNTITLSIYSDMDSLLGSYQLLYTVFKVLGISSFILLNPSYAL